MQLRNLKRKWAKLLGFIIVVVKCQAVYAQNIHSLQDIYSPLVRQFLHENAEQLGIPLVPDKDENLYSYLETMVTENQFKYRYVSTLAISPDFGNDQTVFAGVFNGGIFKSTDRGVIWLKSDTGLDDLHVRTIAISPDYANDQTIFAGAYKYSGTGRVYKSTDGGNNWIQLNFSPGSVREIAFSPNYTIDETIFAASFGSGVLKSTNGGMNWIQLQGSQEVTIALSPEYPNDSIIFVGNGGGINKSTDGGNTWEWIYGEQLLPGDPPLWSTGDIKISPNFSIDYTVFAATYLGVARSLDADTTWEIVLPVPIGEVVLSPAYATDQTVFAAGIEGVYKSTDGGTNWDQINSGLTNLTVERVIISPEYPVEPILLVGTHEGLFLTTDETNWSSVGDSSMRSIGIEKVTDTPNVIDALPTIVIDSIGTAHVGWHGAYVSAGAPSRVVTDAFYTNNQNGSFTNPTLIPVQQDNFSLYISITTDSGSSCSFNFSSKRVTIYS